MYVSYYDKIAITNLSGKFLCCIRRLVRSTKICRANQSVGLRAIIALIKVSTNPRLLPFHKHCLDQRRTDEISFVGRLLVSGKALLSLISTRTQYSSKDCIVTMYAGCHYFDESSEREDRLVRVHGLRQDVF